MFRNKTKARLRCPAS